jgi:UDP-3-O-[3-hydroxymyristoyl] glucosamine N-acyltransferase
MAGSLSLQAIADLVGGRLVGDGDVVVDGVGPAGEAGPTQIAFLAAKRYARRMDESSPAAYLVSADLESLVPEGVPHVVVEATHPALRAVLNEFHPRVEWEAGIHPTAVIAPGVQLGEDVRIGPYVVLEEGVRIGDRTRIDAHCVLGENTVVGRGCRFYPHVVIYHDTEIGDEVVLHAGVRVGSDGFGYTFMDGHHAKMPQIGRAIIESGVEVGANTCVDRGSLGDTRVGAGSKLDNLVQIGHNVRIGALSLLASMSGVAGSTRLGKGVFMGGQAGTAPHLEIADGAKVAVQGGVTRDIPPGVTVSGYPARPHREQLRLEAHIHRLPKLAARVAELEKEIERLRGKE